MRGRVSLPVERRCFHAVRPRAIAHRKECGEVTDHHRKSYHSGLERESWNPTALLEGSLGHLVLR